MAGYVTVDSSHHGVGKKGQLGICNEELHDYGARWYFSRKEIEENSPSRRDGIDLKKETYLRKSYSTFLQELGMRLRVPQVTIATAIVFCHRFFLRQSHAKNDRRTIATVCMFLAGKIEETPRPLKEVILVSYEIIHKKDPFAAQKIKPKEAYEQQKELILLGEKLVLATLGFDMNVQHPYKPLVDAIKKFKVAKNALAKVAWNFLNDGLRTSLCLQFKPQHIAAGAIFLAAKFIKVKLPSDGDKVWWQEFNVTPRQLEDVSNQLLELYEQNHTAQFTGTTNSTVSESSVSVNNAVKKNDVIERKIDDGIDLAVEDEKMRLEKKMMGWPKPLSHPLPRTSMTRKPLEFVNGRTDDEQPKEEDGELSSLDEHDYSQKLQGYNVKVVSGMAAKRKLDEVWSDQPGRDHKRFR